MLVSTTQTRQSLSRIVTPESTKTHFPLSHSRCVDLIASGIEKTGWQIKDEKIETTKGGARMFGYFAIGGMKDLDYDFTIGFRNSHDKRFSFGLALGQRVMVCSNESFFGDFMLKRCHTRFAGRDLPNLIDQGIDNMRKPMVQLYGWINDLKQSELVDCQVHDCLIRSMRAGVISGQQIPKVLQQWETPNHPEFKPRTRWSLHNAFTEVLKENSPRVRQDRGWMLNKLFNAPVSVN